MASSNLGNIKAVTPDDSTVLPEFNYIQCSVSGDITIVTKEGDSVLILAALLDRMAIVPVGAGSKVMATGTTATGIYAW